MVITGTKTSAKKTSSLATGLAEKLREDILTEKVMPGAKLTEKDVCECYSVSRTPVREALKNLETEGLIELIPNRGAYVIGFSLGDIKDIFELKKTYEVLAVKWAIRRIYENELEELEKCFEYMKFYTKQNEYGKVNDINRHFHNRIYEATHNRTLTNILNLYNCYIRHSALTNPVSRDDLDIIFEEHFRIFNAFIMQDEHEGVSAISDHLDGGMERYLV